MITVAGDRPYDALSLLDEPLWRVLWTFHHLMDLRAHEQLRARLARVDAGMMTALSFHAPQLLNDELTHVRDAIEERERGPALVPAKSLDERAEAMLARITAGRVLSPEALVS